MKTIKEYQNRFYNLLESKSGDVKPLLMEKPKKVDPNTIATNLITNGGFSGAMFPVGNFNEDQFTYNVYDIKDKAAFDSVEAVLKGKGTSVDDIMDGMIAELGDNTYFVQGVCVHLTKLGVSANSCARKTNPYGGFASQQQQQLKNNSR